MEEHPFLVVQVLGGQDVAELPGGIGTPAVEIDGALAEHLEVLRLTRYFDVGVVKGRREAHPLDLALGDAVDGSGRLHLEDVEHGRHQVDGVRELRSNGVLGLDALGPVDDAQVGCAATRRFAFPATEGRVGGVRPAPGVMRIGRRIAPLGDVLQVLGQGVGNVVEEQILVEGAVRAAFGRGAVVGDEDDQRVVELVHHLEEGDQLADVVIHIGKVRGVNFHLVGVNVLLLLVQRLPRLHVRIGRRELRFRGADAHLDLVLQGFLAVIIPAGVELALVLGDPFLGGVVRSMASAGAKYRKNGRSGATCFKSAMNSLALSVRSGTLW